MSSTVLSPDSPAWLAAVRFHGHACPGLAIGCRMALAAVLAFDLDASFLTRTDAAFRRTLSPDEELVCGEFNDFVVLPKSRFIDGAQSHILAPLGVSKDGSEWGRWRRPGARRSGAYMLDYVRRANQAGMPVTVDIFVDHRGRWDEAQFEALKYVGDHL